MLKKNEKKVVKTPKVGHTTEAFRGATMNSVGSTLSSPQAAPSPHQNPNPPSPTSNP